MEVEMRGYAVLVLAGLALVSAAAAGCRQRVPPKYDNKPVVAPAAPSQPHGATR
jgi:hypothetical protein